MQPTQDPLTRQRRVRSFSKTLDLSNPTQSNPDRVPGSMNRRPKKTFCFPYNLAFTPFIGEVPMKHSNQFFLNITVFILLILNIGCSLALQIIAVPSTERSRPIAELIPFSLGGPCQGLNFDDGVIFLRPPGVKSLGFTLKEGERVGIPYYDGHLNVWAGITPGKHRITTGYHAIDRGNQWIREDVTYTSLSNLTVEFEAIIGHKYYAFCWGETKWTAKNKNSLNWGIKVLDMSESGPDGEYKIVASKEAILPHR